MKTYEVGCPACGWVSHVRVPTETNNTYECQCGEMVNFYSYRDEMPYGWGWIILMPILMGLVMWAWL